jgi:hypothetical protein
MTKSLKLKVGDKVRRIRDNGWILFDKGDIGLVINVTGFNSDYVLTNLTCPNKGGHYSGSSACYDDHWEIYMDIKELIATNDIIGLSRAILREVQ